MRVKSIMAGVAESDQILVQSKSTVGPRPNVMHVQLYVHMVRCASAANTAPKGISLKHPHPYLWCRCAIHCCVWQQVRSHKAYKAFLYCWSWHKPFRDCALRYVAFDDRMSSHEEEDAKVG